MHNRIIIVHVQDLSTEMLQLRNQGIQYPGKVPSHMYIHTCAAITKHLTIQIATGDTITQFYDIKMFSVRSYQ